MQRLGAVVGLALLMTLGMGAGQTRASDPGEAVFKASCAACHSVSEGVNRVGPSLAGVVGRPAGAITSYSYSEANRKSSVTWTEDRLDAYLTNPEALIPGTKMIFMGIKDAAKRAALIAYLKTR